jgi:ketosteroid isomerase-like protein
MPTNKQIIQGAYKAFAEGDLPNVLAVMDDKIEWTEAEGFPLHGTYVGPQRLSTVSSCAPVRSATSSRLFRPDS